MPTIVTDTRIIAMRDFLMTVPSSPWGELIAMNYVDIEGTWTGDAIVPAGESVIRRRGDIIGNEIHECRTSYAIIMRRNTNTDFDRSNIVNFQTFFINWVNNEQYKRNTPAANPLLPRFSMTQNERISADGGIRTAVLEGNMAEFSIQIHSDYELKYYTGILPLK